MSFFVISAGGGNCSRSLIFCKAIIYNLLLVAHEQEEVNLHSIVLPNLEPLSFFFLDGLAASATSGKV